MGKNNQHYQTRMDSKQFSLFPDEGIVSDSNSVSLANVSDTKPLAHQYFQKNTKPYISTYSPAGRQTNYYRFSYRDGKTVKHIHIPGGNSASDLVQYRVKRIQGLIDRGLPISKISKLIVSYKGKNNHKI